MKTHRMDRLAQEGHEVLTRIRYFKDDTATTCEGAYEIFCAGVAEGMKIAKEGVTV